jgi:carbonic anhydrase/acetyltransferase-like protein (isoleucine patch superfamily)
VIPPRSFVVGRPAKAAREVSERDLVMIRAASAGYVEYAAEFRATCTQT